MAPRPSQQRRTLGPQSEQFHELGVAGRKTGITLKDTGVRDEHGMEPIDALFSSPRKEASEQEEEEEEEEEGDDGSGEDMDITTTSGIGPAALLNGHTTRLQMPLPQSRSPVKTSLGSPAQRNRLLARSSSPLHGAGLRPAQSSSQPARHQFTMKASMDFNRLQAGAKSLSQPTNLSGGGRHQASRRAYDEEEEEEEEEDDEVDAFVDQSLEMLGGDDDDDDDDMVGLPAADYDSPAEEEEPVQATAASKRKPGRKPKPKESPQAAKPGRKPARRVEPEPEPEPEEEEEEEEEEQSEADEPSEAEEPPAKPQQRGRLTKNTAAPSRQIARAALSSATSKKRRTPDDAEESSEPKSKKARTASPAAGTTAPRGRGRPKANTAPGEAPKKTTPAPAEPAKPKRGRKRKSSIDPNQVIIPRGPPLPKSRGLMINSTRNEDANNMHRTRSGRTSYKPLAFWRNEHVEFEMEEAVDDFAAPGAKAKKFLLPSIKEVVRVDEPEVEISSTRKKKSSKKHGGAGRPGYHDPGDAIADAWEKNPGAVEGEVQLWDPEHEKNPPGPDDEVEYMDRQLAISGRAIKTSKVKNATFKFAKTVSEGFFGAGVVDMPPGSVKTQKNSRKMFMTFFVFTGRVSVTVGDNEFRISRGGMWFVPRGNYYSIENGYDQPARIFFAQGCEVQPNSGEGMGDQSVMMSVEADQSQAE